MNEKLNPNAHTDFIGFYGDFINLYGKEKGDEIYYAMLKSYGLDDTQSYSSQTIREQHNRVQVMYECLNGVCKSLGRKPTYIEPLTLSESFSWTNEYFKLINTDKDAKYYKVRALTASLSANKNDYRDLEDLERSARTLIWRPLNLNHDPMQMLPFPQNRVDWAEFEDKAVEAIIRIDNQQKDIQDKIDNGEIVNPSIEGEPRGGYRTPEGNKVPKWYNFIALALLEKDKTLPGVPSTYGFEPLFLNESLGRSLVESLSLETEKTKEKTMTEQNEVELEEEAVKEPLEEYKGIQGMDMCGQCKFYEELSDTTTQAPAAPGSDATVTHSAGAIGPGVGKCAVSGGYIRKADSVCSDGRPRDQPTDLDRTIEMKKIELEAKNMEQERKITDLENQVLLAKQDTRLANEGKLTAMQESLAKDEDVKRLQNEKAELQSKASRLAEQLEKERLDNRTLGSDNDRFKVETDSLEADNTLLKDRLGRLQDELREGKTTKAKLQESLTRATTKANDESALRAQAVQRAIDAENSSAEIQRENALLVEQISSKSQEIYDTSKARSEGAKREMKLQQEIQTHRTKYDKLVEEFREVKRLYNALKNQKQIRVKVKT